MADCYAPEADDLHRRWLPREIFADIGIVDPDPVAAAAAAAAAAAKPDVAAAVDVEELAVQLAGIIGAGAGTEVKGNKLGKKRSPPPPPPVAPAPTAAPCPLAPGCGLEGGVVVAYGGGNVVAGGAAVAWQVTPYSPVTWQVPSNYSMLPPAPPRLVLPRPGALKLRGGTGVFLPRADAYRHAQPHRPAKDAKAPSPRSARPVQEPQQQKGGVAAAAEKAQPQQQWQCVSVQQKPKKAADASPDVDLASPLPQDWSYH